MDIERPTPKQPMPADARLVFKGVIFDAYQWEQELFDGTTATFERLKRADTTVVVPVTADGRILILEQQQPGRPPFISFPGGRVEPGERPDEAARRELMEETGYAPKGDLILWEASQPVTKIDWAVYLFIARGCRQDGTQHLDSGEKISVKLVTFEELAAMAEAGTFGKEMAVTFLRAKLDAQEMRELRATLLGS